MPAIVDVYARQILDSRGNPTIEVDVILEDGTLGRAAIPSGASTGANEAVELRDGDKDCYLGNSVYNAIENVNEKIAEEIIGSESTDQNSIDLAMIQLDGTENKSNLGANSMLGVSIAVADASAKYYQMPLFKYIGGCCANVLPVPMMNILNGGKHADNNVDIQEFMIMPYGAESFTKALQMGTEIFHHLKKVLKSKGYNTSVGDEGGFAPSLRSNEEAFDLIIEAIEKSGYKLTDDIVLAIDVAASEMWDNGKYKFYKSTQKLISSDELIKWYSELISNYPIKSIEDGLNESDWEGWANMNRELGDKIQIVGDDLFVTNPKFLERGIIERSANAILIKVNQIGTLSETLKTVEMAKRSGFGTIISHRSGETEDTKIADIAVATMAGQIKTGAPSRTDRVAKYNQLLRIEEYLCDEFIYAGKTVFK